MTRWRHLSARTAPVQGQKRDFYHGLLGGGACVFAVLDTRRRVVEAQKRQQDAEAQRLQGTHQAINARQQVLDEENARLTAARTQLENEAGRLRAARSEFDASVVSYKELQDENTILKRDLRNIDVQVRKHQLDRELLRQTQESLDQKIKDLGSRYLKENVRWIGTSLNPNNFASCKQRLQDVIKRCRGVGFDVSTNEESALLADLQEEYRKVVHAAFEREEQARIRAQIREEQMREREKEELQRKRQQLEREREALKVAVEKALAEAKDQHSAEMERLNSELAAKQAEIDANQRAISQAQITKSGHVYVISNIGSFGEGVFKVGMTRRKEPDERISELGDASVPFPFDVHMMIHSDDAPTLENALHKKLFKLRMNKANPRKEFFKVDFEMIYQIVKEHHGEVEYLADAEALEYRQSLAMSDEDQEIIESVYDQFDEDSKTVADGD